MLKDEKYGYVPLKKLIYIVYTLLIFAAYTPVLISTYAFSDDWATANDSLTGGDSFEWDVLSGRPIFAFYRLAWVKLVHGIDDLFILRLFSVICTICFANSFYSFILKRKIFSDYWMVFLCPLLISLLPSFQVYNSWATCSPFVLSVLLSLTSYRFIATDKFFSYPINLIIASLLLVASFSIYQPTSLTFIFFMMVDYCFGKDRRPQLKEFVGSFAVMVAGLLSSVFLSKILPSIIYGETLSRAQFTNDLTGKVYWFANEAFINAINNFNINPNPTYGYISAFLLIFGLCFQVNKDRPLINYSFCILMPIACYVSNLVIKENWAAFRSLSGLEMSLSFISICGLFFLIKKMGSKFFAPAVLFLMVFVSCQSNIYNYFVGPQQFELTALSSYIDSHISKDYKGVINFKIDDPAYNTFVNGQRYDEFGNISLATPWAVIGMANRIKMKKGFSYNVISQQSDVGKDTTGKDLFINTGDAMRQATTLY